MDDHQYNGNGHAEPMSPSDHRHPQPDGHGHGHDDHVHDLRATLRSAAAHGGSSMEVDQPPESAHRSRTPSRSRSRSRNRTSDRASRSSRSRSRSRTRDRRSRSRSRSRGRRGGGGRDRDRFRDRRARRDATYSPPRNRSPTPPPRAPRFRRPTADQIKNALATLDPDLRRIFAKHKLMEMWVADPIEAMRMHVFIERQKQLGKTNALVVIPPKKVRDKLGVSVLPGGRRDKDRDRDRDRRGGSSYMTMDSFSHPDLWTARVKFGMGRTEVEKLIRDRDEDVAVRRVTALVIVDV